MRALVWMSLWQIKNAACAGLRSPAVWIPVFCIALLALLNAHGQLSAQSALPPDAGPFLRGHLATVHAVVFLTLALMALGYIDSGLAGGALRFAPSDVALLFPAPISRRLVLLFKLPSALSQHLLMIALFAGMFRAFLWLPMQQGHPVGGGWTALLASVLCVAGFLNLSILLDLFSGRGRHPWVRGVFRGIVGIAVATLSWFLWAHGETGLLTVGGSRFLGALFSPCRLTADAVISPFQNLQLSGASWVILDGWCGLTLGLLFTRRVNYYEAAALGTERAERVREAVRSGNWLAIRSPSARAGRLSIPPFGRGGGALVWAHLAAAAKRPGVNFVLPLGGGFGVALLIAVASRLAGGDTGGPGATPYGTRFGLLMVTGYYVFYTGALTPMFYQRSLARETLMRPLPVPMAVIVAADVGAQSLLGALFPVGEGLALLTQPLLGIGALALLLLISAPILITLTNVLGYRLALAYPNGADKFQMGAALFVQSLAYGLLSLVIAPFGVVPALLHAPEWVIVLSVTLGLSLATGILFRQTARAAVAFESSEEPPPATRRRWVTDFRKGIASPPLKKAVKPLIVIAVIIALVAFIGSRVNKAIHKPPTPPRTVLTRRGDLIVTVSETGTIQPVDKVNVESKAPGRLLSIPIVEGQQVQKGQLIAVVDRSQLDPQIAGLRAQLSQAQARLQQTEAQYALQVRQTRMAVAQSQAGLHSAQTHLAAVAAAARPQELAQQTQAVDRARITLEDAKRTQARKQGLLAKGFIAQSDADSAQVAVDTAASNLATAGQALALTQAGPRPQDIADARSQVAAQQIALETARANLGQLAVSRADIAQARAAVSQIQNQLAQFLVQLADTRIVAPASGIVLKKYKQPDEIVQSATTGFSDAQSLIVTLGSRLEVLVGINEVDIPKVRVGAPVTIRVDAVPNAVFTGAVTEVAPASTNAFSDANANASGDSISKFNVKIALSRYDARLRPGMTADVDIVSAHHFHVVLAPQEAVSGTGNKATVTILAASGVKEARTVTLGLRDDTNVEVVRGLRPNEKLIVLPINGKGRRKFNVNSNGG